MVEITPLQMKNAGASCYDRGPDRRMDLKNSLFIESHGAASVFREVIENA
jgi:hypothetical protein